MKRIFLSLLLLTYLITLFSQDKIVGRDVTSVIKGNFAVSPTGAATYTIPIECPEGIAELRPGISLVYNS